MMNTYIWRLMSEVYDEKSVTIPIIEWPKI